MLEWPHGEHEPVAAAASAGRRGCAASPSGTAGRPPVPGSSRCRGGRCRPSAPRPWPAPERCPPPSRRGRSSPALRHGDPLQRLRDRRGRARRRAYSPGAIDCEPHLTHPTRGFPVTYVGQSASAAARRRRSGSRGSARPSGDVVAAYVGLTKPRVIELLLLTTVPGDVLRRAGHSRRSGWSSPPSSAARCPPGRRRPSTASTTATSTSRCAVPAAGRFHATSFPRAPPWSSGWCSASSRR